MSTSKQDNDLEASLGKVSLEEKTDGKQEEKPKAFDGPNHLLIAHWNMGGVGTHCWKKGTLFALAETLNPSPDVILLSEIKSFNVENDMYPGHDYKYEVLPPLQNPAHRGLCILYKKSLTPVRYSEEQIRKRSDDQSTEFLYLDFLLSNGIHRVAVVYHEHKDNATIQGSCPEHIADFLKQELLTQELTKDSPHFVHILGDFNLPKAEDATKLNGYLNGNSELLLKPSWETYGENQLDLIFSFSCDPKSSINGSVLAHPPFHPYDDLVKKIEKGNRLVKGSTEMFTETSEQGVTLKLTVSGYETCEPALAPGNVHKVLLLHIGNNVNSQGKLHCQSDSAEKCSKFYKTNIVKRFLKGTHSGCDIFPKKDKAQKQKKSTNQ